MDVHACKKTRAKINVRNAKKYLNEIKLSTDDISENPSSTEKAEQTKRQAKTKKNNELKEGWKDKLLHGKYPICASDSDVSFFLIYLQLASLGMQSETEEFIIAAQGQSFPTRNYRANILENGTDPKFKVCNKHCDTIDHLVSCCPMLVPTKYLNRHDRLGHYILWCLYKDFGLPHESNWWDHKPPKVIENKNATIVWDSDIHTDRTIHVIRPGIAVKTHNDKPCFLIDMAVPIDTGVSLEIFEKLSKYKDSKIEVSKTWHLKTTNFPVVIGTLGMVAKSVPNYVSKISGAPTLIELENNTNGHHICPAKSIINAIYFLFFVFLHLIPNTYNKCQT